MSWPVLAATAVGLVVGINLGVLLMVALQAGRRQDDAYGEASLRVRIAELEAALSRQVEGGAAPDVPASSLHPTASSPPVGGPDRTTATG